ncbi:E3 ubiquitin-protein ligase RNF8-like [Amphibalanus amphitrite]|uniref:E3 ubiquitin-protein ligase RNF8-like n=1 Tax=Amphibalanus amphitrite TaxID=1232801 RepID=UPI001C92A23D|nr:E3 ubiquitin-protein ligase RNF8-like [Amphibalanus amphitrite]
MACEAGSEDEEQLNLAIAQSLSEEEQLTLAIALSASEEEAQLNEAVAASLTEEEEQSNEAVATFQTEEQPTSRTEATSSGVETTTNQDEDCLLATVMAMSQLDVNTPSPGTESAPHARSSTALQSELNCPVCLELFNKATTLGCGHTFCAGCVGRSRSGNNKCPMCRKSINSTVHCIALDNVIKALAARD